MKIFNRLIVIAVLFSFIPACGGSDSDGDGSGGGTFSYEITDTDENFPLGKFVASVFIDAVYQEGASVETETPVTTSNSVKIENLKVGKMNEIYVWIDSGGGSPFAPDKYIYTTAMTEIADELGIETNAMIKDVENMDVTMSTGGTSITGTAHCIWLPAGSLDAGVDVASLYSEEGRDNCRNIVGYVNADFSSADTATANAANYSWPLPTISFGTEYRYTLVVIVDTNSNETRDSGDYEGITSQVNASNEDTEQITILVVP